jgi:hypothetical protein
LGQTLRYRATAVHSIMPDKRLVTLLYIVYESQAQLAMLLQLDRQTTHTCCLQNQMDAHHHLEDYSDAWVPRLPAVFRVSVGFRCEGGALVTQMASCSGHYPPTLRVCYVLAVTELSPEGINHRTSSSSTADFTFGTTSSFPGSSAIAERVSPQRGTRNTVDALSFAARPVEAYVKELFQ